MIRKLLGGVALAAALTVAVGCDQAKDAAKKAEDEAAKAKVEADKAKDMIDAKAKVLDPIKAAMPQIEEKLKALSGDSLKAATDKIESLKKLIAEFSTAPADKYKDVGAKLTAMFDEVKKMVGL